MGSGAVERQAGKVVPTVSKPSIRYQQCTRMDSFITTGPERGTGKAAPTSRGWVATVVPSLPCEDGAAAASSGACALSYKVQITFPTPGSQFLVCCSFLVLHSREPNSSRFQFRSHSQCDTYTHGHALPLARTTALWAPSNLV